MAGATVFTGVPFSGQPITYAIPSGARTEPPQNAEKLTGEYV